GAEEIQDEPGEEHADNARDVSAVADAGRKETAPVGEAGDYAGGAPGEVFPEDPGGGGGGGESAGVEQGANALDGFGGTEDDPAPDSEKGKVDGAVNGEGY